MNTEEFTGPNRKPGWHLLLHLWLPQLRGLPHVNSQGGQSPIQHCRKVEYSWWISPVDDFIKACIGGNIPFSYTCVCDNPSFWYIWYRTETPCSTECPSFSCHTDTISLSSPDTEWQASNINEGSNKAGDEIVTKLTLTIPHGPVWHFWVHLCSPHSNTLSQVSTQVGTSWVQGSSNSVLKELT